MGRSMTLPHGAGTEPSVYRREAFRLRCLSPVSESESGTESLHISVPVEVSRFGLYFPKCQSVYKIWHFGN